MQHHTEAIKLLQDWSKWLVGIDSAAIAALTTRPRYDLEAMAMAMAFATATSGMVAAAFFLTSLLMANWLLLALPGVLQRASEHRGEDIFSEGTYCGVGLRVVFFARAQHVFFIAGILATMAFVLAPYYPAWCWGVLAAAGFSVAPFAYELARWPARFRK